MKSIFSRSRIAIAALLISCIGTSRQQACGQPISPASPQWKQSIERPSPGWDYDGKRILGHVDHDICLWDAETGKLLYRLKEHEERIQRVQFSPDGAYALSSSWISPGPMTDVKSKDARTVLWNLETGRSSQIFPGQVAGEFSPDGKRIVTFSQRPESCSFDAAVWDVQTGRELIKVTLVDGRGPYWDALHFSPDGQRLVYVANGAFLLYNSSAAVFYDATDGREIGRAAAKHGIHRYTSGGALAAFDSERISLVDIESGRTLRGFEHGVNGVWRGAWTHDGSKVAAFPINGPIQVWDVESGSMIAGAQGGVYAQRHAIISPNNSRFAMDWCGVDAKTQKDQPAFGLYDVNTGTEIAVVQLAREEQMVGFSPDSTTLLVAGAEAAIYNAADGKKVRSLTLENLTNNKSKTGTTADEQKD